jgi:hypothetical protein
MPFDLTPRQAEGNRILGGPYRHVMAKGGARSGKTFLLVRANIIRALRAPLSRHLIVRFRANAVWRAIGLDTLPKVMRTCFPHIKYKVNKSEKYFTLPNGAEIWLGGLDDKERVDKILGQEYATIYFNEASEIGYSAYLVAITRLAQVCPGLAQRCYVDLNPGAGAHWTNRLFVLKQDPDTRKPILNPDDYAHFQINPTDNAQNLSPEFLKSLENLPERQRKRFWEGQFTNDVDGALWPLEIIDRARCEPDDVPEFKRVVVSIDPSGTAGGDDSRSDDVGIIVAGLGVDGVAYLLADLTCNLSPMGWARVAVNAFHKYQADRIIAERNYGGAMVGALIRTADPKIPFSEVVASRGKAVRAEPVAALYEQGKVRHAGRFSQLEEQLSNFSTLGYLGDRSPDRADALVWAITELMLVAQPAAPVFSTYGAAR